MPKHIRMRLSHSFQKILDDSWEFQELERLTEEEKRIVVAIRNSLLGLQEKATNLIAIVDARGELQLPPRKTDGPSFSWAEHDARCNARRKIKRLEKELRQTCKELAEVEHAR